MRKFLFRFGSVALLVLSANLARGQYARHSPLLSHIRSTEQSSAQARVVTLTIKPESREAFLKVVNDLEAQTRREPGCLSYSFYEDANQPNTFLIVGEWATAADLETHRRESYAVAYFNQLPEWLAQPSVTTAY